MELLGLNAAARTGDDRPQS